MTTKTTQFTPGPWNVRHYRVAPTNCQWSDVTDSTGGLITHVPSSKGNAALIAAAPAMYEVLKQAIDELADYEAARNDPKSITRYRCEAALAQAEGRHHE